MYNFGQTHGQQIPTTSYNNVLGMTHNPYLMQTTLGALQGISQAAQGLNAIGGNQAIGTSFEATQILMRIEAQLALVTDLLRVSLQGRNYNGVQAEINPIRLRESDSAIYCELYLAQLTVGDVEVEVNGNRVICRTLVPFAQINRWYSVTSMPRGFEFFQLPDGRVEFAWTCPVSFNSKDIEASFREGFLCISIPKTHVATTAQKVKVAKESNARVQ
jgi:HSP20 family molecular chaperone IbpA